MIRRIDQAIRVHEMMVSAVKLSDIADDHKRAYLLRYLEIITAVCSVLLIKSGTPENLQKMHALWGNILKQQPDVYAALRRRLLGRFIHLPGALGRRLVVAGYHLSQKIFGFN